MSYFLLFVTVLSSAFTNIFGKYYNQRHSEKIGSSEMYNFIQVGSVFALWLLIFVLKPEFEPGVLVYSLMFSIFYIMFMVSVINALKIGSVALTTLIPNLASVVVTAWGFLFWNDSITFTVMAGLVLVVISLFLCVPNSKKSEKKFSVKWLVLTFLAFIGNAGCSIVQKTQQIVYEGKYGNMLMLFATFAAFSVFAVIFIRSDKSCSKAIIKNGSHFPVLSGMCNVGFNVLVIALAVSELSPSLIYPVIGVGTIAVVSLFSLAFFKEKLTIKQWLGIMFGATATVLLSV